LRLAAFVESNANVIRMTKRKPITIGLHIVIAFILALLGFFTFTGNKVFLGGRLAAGKFYELSELGTLLTSISLLLFSIFVLLVLFEGKQIKVLTEITVTVALLLFFVGVFI
jgi:hypothetical protein